MPETSSTTQDNNAPPSAPAPTPQAVEVKVTAPTVPSPVVDGYTQLVLTVIALLLAAIAIILLMRFSQDFHSIDDVFVFGPNGPKFDEAPLIPAIKDELQKLNLSWRYIPLGRVFLTTAPDKTGNDGQSMIWGIARANRWKDAGFVVLKDQVDLAKSPGLSQDDRKRLSAVGVEARATIEATEKGKEHACDAESSKTFGGACLEAPLGDFDRLRIVRTEWGKKGIYHFRLVLATFDLNPSPAMQALYKDHNFWRFECATVLQHDPFRDTWRVVAFNAGQMDDPGLDTSEITKLWSTMEAPKSH